jgi:hypothetical protein
MDVLSMIASLSDSELLEGTARAAARERGATTRLVAHLAEMDARRLYLGEGYASLFAYCTSALGLSEGSAMSRIDAARAVRKFPAVLPALAEGQVHLTAVRLLAPILTEENHGALLREARGKSRSEVEAIVARLRPAPPVPSSIRRVPLRAPIAESLAIDLAREPAPLLEPEHAAVDATAVAATPVPAPIAGSAAANAAADLSAARSTPLVPAARVAPLAPGSYSVRFTASTAMHERLLRAQALLRHRVPSGDIAQVLDLALVALLNQVEGRKTGRKRSRPARGARHLSEDAAPPAGTAAPGGASQQERASLQAHASVHRPASRHIPANVRRAVWERDRGRCAFRSSQGRLCGETGFLEYHHEHPFARGGPATLENIELRCRAHNQYEAELDFGASHMCAVRSSSSQPLRPAPPLGSSRFRSESAIERKNTTGRARRLGRSAGDEAPCELSTHVKDFTTAPRNGSTIFHKLKM